VLKFFVHSVVLIWDHFHQFHSNQIHDEHELNVMHFHLGSQTDSQFVKLTFNPPNLRSVGRSAFRGVNLCDGLIASRNQPLVFENNSTTLRSVFLCRGEKNSKDGPYDLA
jgi:hypothetical protein